MTREHIGCAAEVGGAEYMSGETMRRAAELHDRTFGGLDGRRAEIVRMVIRFFGAASDAYAATLRTEASERMKSLLPGAHAARACEMYRGVKGMLEAAGVSGDNAEIADAVQKTREWLEELGWVLIPCDLPGFDGYVTTAGVVRDMVEYSRDAVKMMAVMAAEIDARRKR